MVKTLDAVDTTIDLDITAKGMRNVWFDGTYYFMADISGNNGYIYRYNSSWANKTEVWSGSITVENVDAFAVPCIFYNNSTYYVGFSTSGGAYSIHSYTLTYTIVKSTTSGGGSGTWSAAQTYVGLISAKDPANIQILAIGTTTYFMAHFIVSGTGGGVRIWTDDFLSSDLSPDIFSQITGCYSDGTNIYFMGYFVTVDTYFIYSWNAIDSYTKLSSPILTNGVDLDFDYAQFWQIGTSQFITWKNTFYYWLNATDGWILISNTSSNTPVAHWYLNGSTLAIRGITFGNMYIETAAIAIKKYILTTTLTPKFAWDSYVGEATNLYQITAATTTSVISCLIKNWIESAAECRIDLSVVPVEDSCMKVYNDSGVLLIQGIVKYNEDESDYFFKAEITPFIRIDLDKIIDYTSNGSVTVATAFADIITANFGYGSAGTLTSSATTYPFSYTAKKVRDIFSEMARLDGRIWYCSPTDQIYLDNGSTDSGFDITTDVNYKKASLLDKIGTVELWGKGAAYFKKIENLSNGYYSDSYPNFNQSQLVDLSTSILAATNTKVVQYTITDVAAIGYPQIGKQITFAQTGIASAEYYTKEIWYDVLSNVISKFIIQDVLHFSKKQMSPTIEKVQAQTVELNTDIHGGNESAGIETSIVNVDSSISTTVDNYKKAGADDWTTPYTASAATITYEDNDGHADTMQVAATAQNYPQVYKDYLDDATHVYASCWLKINTLSNGSILVAVRNTSNQNVMYFAFSTTSASIAGTSSYAAGIKDFTKWHHILIDATKKGIVYGYIDGDLAGVVTANDFYCERFTVIGSTTGMTIDINTDAMYFGTDYKAAWGSLYPDAILSRQLITRYGFRGYHSLEFMNANTVTWSGTLTGATSGNVILNLVAGISNETTITQTEENWAVKVPPNAICADIVLIGIADNAHQANAIIAVQNGNTNNNQSVRVYCGGVANYYVQNNNRIRLRDGSINVKFSSGNSSYTITGYVTIMGYEI